MSNNNPPLDTITLTVGTAGHIDHGKTQMVKYLTGCNTDCLPEEKKRGMTIDLGFATCELPNHRRVGIVDVPGHEKFIHNMVAGAAGIDCVIMVVAADDGVMPQTIEHFHIVRLLGISSGMIVITKTDLVEGSRVDEVKKQIEELTAGSFLANCPIIPFSSKTGEGFDEFYSTFVTTVDKTAERNAEGSFRLNVERSFILKGLGTVISGIPRSGSVQIGDKLEFLPEGSAKKVKGIQVYGKDAGSGKAGECVALRLSNISHEEAIRGTILATPGCFTSTKYINAKLHLLPGIRSPLKPRTKVRFHIGTTVVSGNVILPSFEPLEPGQESYAQFQLEEPIVAAPGDFFVIRLLSPVTTIGGGYVVCPEKTKLRRAKTNWIDDCRKHEEAFKKPVTALEYVLGNNSQALHLSELANQAFINIESAKKYIPELLKNGVALEITPERYIHPHTLSSASDEIVEALNQLHDKNPMNVAFSKKKVFLGISTDRTILEKALTQLIDTKQVMTDNSEFYIKEKTPTLSPNQSALGDKILQLYKDSGFTSPRQDKLPEELGTPAVVINPVFDFLTQTGELIIISDKVVMHREYVELSREKIIEYLQENESLESGEFKDILQTTRKYSIPILEYWDKQGLTKRTGNKRTLRN